MRTNRADSKNYWNIGSLPFYVNCQDTPTNQTAGLPDSLPFSLMVDKNTSLIKQQYRSEVALALEKAYKIGSIITGAMDKQGIGQQYAKDFFNFISKCLQGNFAGKKILEIGCGSGYLLSLIREEGASVLGIEPGPQGKQGGSEFNIPIISDFFPTEHLEGTFDVIIAYAVLEHIIDPFAFLDSVNSILNVNGCLILAVPDCEPYLIYGDISFLIHEHWNYFTSKTLLSTLGFKGYSGSCINARFGGSIYGCFKKGKPIQSRTENVLSTFKNKSNHANSQISDLLHSFNERGESIGIYVAARMINVLSLATNSLLNKMNIRFFDDNELILGKYYPGFNIRIESYGDLIDEPVDKLIIASKSFGNKIRQKLISHLKDTTFIQWEDLFIYKEGQNAN